MAAHGARIALTITVCCKVLGARVIAENSYTGETRHIVSAYLTFVALDEHNRAIDVPPVQPESDIEAQRFREAEVRRRLRLDHAKTLHAMREGRT